MPNAEMAAGVVSTKLTLEARPGRSDHRRPSQRLLPRFLRPEAQPGNDPPLFAPAGLQFVALDEPLDWQRLPPRFADLGLWRVLDPGTNQSTPIRARIGQRGLQRSLRNLSRGCRRFARRSARRFQKRVHDRCQRPARPGRGPGSKCNTPTAHGRTFSEKISARRFSTSAPRPENQLWKIGDYATWTKRYDALSLSADRRAIKEHVDRFPAKPLISIVTAESTIPPPLICGKRSSGFAPSFIPHWELCLVDDGSSAKHVRPLLTRYARKDARIKVHFREKNGGIAAASNDALGLTRGEFVALLDDDDVPRVRRTLFRRPRNQPASGSAAVLQRRG